AIMVAAAGFVSVSAQPVIDDSVLALIEQQTVDNSQVMEIARMMNDVYGPRLTGSPGIDEATAWAVSQLTEWGLENVHLDPWGPFGRGWELNRFSMNVTAPTTFPVLAFPKAWSSSTDGKVTQEVVLVDVKTEEDFEKYRGRLKGKFVMVSQPADVEPDFEGEATRRTDTQLLDLASASLDGGGRRYTEEQLAAYRFRGKVATFVYEEGPAAIFDRSYKADRGTIAVSQASVPRPADAGRHGGPKAWDIDRDYVIPQVSLATEHYNRLYRLAESGQKVEIELELDVTWFDDDPMENNIIAEIPGTDPEIGDEVVMLGGHFDSWHAGTGATDDGAGSSVMMEVVRVLKQVYAQKGTGPRRTIRIALWTGEEQGLLGSRAYIRNNVAEAGENGERPVSTMEEWDKISAYYNMDNGTGKIRGVFLQGNDAVRPIFRDWLKPYKDLGAQTLTISNTGGTDHLAFDAVGIPGFQFIQDGIDYGSITHHTNMDTFDHLVEDDLKQAATVIAGFV
ncbi:MAG: M28 family peptidase, partial [Rhodothermia bacterium]